MVFVIDKKKQPQPMIHPAEARKLLRDGKAAVFRKAPFTIILSKEGPVPDRTYRLKIDYGSKHTGLAILDDSRVLWLGQIDHRTNIKDALDKRRGYRRRRRSANLRYRKPRFTYRSRQDGWLPPSLLSRVDNVKTVVRRLQKLAPVGTLSYENVKFDTQLIQDEMISGVRYQQGELAGYEVREYLLEKFKHQCAYCGMSGVPLEVEHIIPKSRGGTNRISNLAIACHTCNQKKGSMTAAEFGHAEVQAQAKAPLRDAALVTATRWAVFRMLQQTGLPVECGSGGRLRRRSVNTGTTAHKDTGLVFDPGSRKRKTSAHKCQRIRFSKRILGKTEDVFRLQDRRLRCSECHRRQKGRDLSRNRIVPEDRII